MRWRIPQIRWTRAVRSRAALAAGITALAVTAGYVAQSFVTSLAPSDPRFGWAGPEAVKLAAPLVAQMPTFQIVNDEGVPIVQDNQSANVRLWKFVQEANGGTYPTNIPQQIGDCTSWGAKHCIEAVQGAQIAAGQSATFHTVFSPYLYGASRVLVGKSQLRGDGSTGAWTAQAAMDYGVLPTDAPGVPAYSGTIAKQWGQQGPPQSFRDVADKYRIKTTSLMRSASDVRDAICNGYGVTIASNWGSTNMRPQDGRIVAHRNTQWPHQMCIDGYDGSVATKYFHIQNSWGPNAHPQPIDDSPPGGFWIEWDDCEYIVRQGDSFAYSAFDGFPAQDLDFHLFGHHRPQPQENTHAKRHLTPVPARARTGFQYAVAP